MAVTRKKKTTGSKALAKKSKASTKKAAAAKKKAAAVKKKSAAVKKKAAAAKKKAAVTKKKVLAAKKKVLAAKKKVLAAKKKALAAKRKAALLKKKKKTPARKKKKTPALKKKSRVSKKKMAASKKFSSTKKKTASTKKKPIAKKRPAAEKRTPKASAGKGRPGKRETIERVASVPEPRARMAKLLPTREPSQPDTPEDAGVPTTMFDEQKTHRLGTADVIGELASDLFPADDDALGTITPVRSDDDDDEDLSLWGQGPAEEPADTDGRVVGSWATDGADDPDKTTLFSRAGTDVDDNSWDEPSASAKEKTKIAHSFELAAAPQDVYDAYMDDGEHAELTGKPADIERYVSGHMEVLDGDVIGDFIELEDGSRIVQTWRTSLWPEDADPSQLTLTFEPTDDGFGTKVTVLHENVPVDQVDGSRDMLEEYYWEPLKQRFG